MGDLLIRNIPENVKREIERAARRDGRSLSDTAIGLLQRSLVDSPADNERFVSAWDELRPLLYDGNAEEADEFARIMEEVEAEGKRDFGRPVPEPDE